MAAGEVAAVRPREYRENRPSAGILKDLVRYKPTVLNCDEENTNSLACFVAVPWTITGLCLNCHIHYLLYICLLACTVAPLTSLQVV